MEGEGCTPTTPNLSNGKKRRGEGFTGGSGLTVLYGIEKCLLLAHESSLSVPSICEGFFRTLCPVSALKLHRLHMYMWQWEQHCKIVRSNQKSLLKAKIDSGRLKNLYLALLALIVLEIHVHGEPELVFTWISPLWRFVSPLWLFSKDSQRVCNFFCMLPKLQLTRTRWTRRWRSWTKCGLRRWCWSWAYWICKVSYGK